jgi:hypothetical protein
VPVSLVAVALLPVSLVVALAPVLVPVVEPVVVPVVVLAAAPGAGFVLPASPVFAGAAAPGLAAPASPAAEEGGARPDLSVAPGVPGEPVVCASAPAAATDNVAAANASITFRILVSFEWSRSAATPCAAANRPARSNAHAHRICRRAKRLVGGRTRTYGAVRLDRVRSTT